MRNWIIGFLILSNAAVYAQLKDTYELTDSVIVVGERNSDDNLSQQQINVKGIQSTGFTNYDLLEYLKIIGINSTIDFNTLPYVEGADFNEQQFFINNIPIPFQSRLIGLQSGLNSLLFSQISLIEAHSINNFSKPIKLEATTNDIDTSHILVKSNINFLHLENVVSIPMKSINSSFVFGYNRSFLESVRPFISDVSNKSNFNFNQFPFFQSFQFLASYKTPTLSIKPLFIYSEDNGIVGISNKKFNFDSKQYNFGTDIEFGDRKIMQTFQLFSNAGKNRVDYKFAEAENENITGLTNLSFLDYGIISNTIYNTKPTQKLKLSVLYKFQNSKSDNLVSFENKFQSASFASNYLSGKIYFINIFSDKIISTLYGGLSTNQLDQVNPSFGLDLSYYNPDLFDTRFQINYDTDQDPTNPVFFSFQNTVWNPSSSSGLFFVDEKSLPLKPIHFVNASLHLVKRIKSQFLESDLSVKFFLRYLTNLIYADNYPAELTIYNSDLGFNQDYSGTRYGVSFLFKNYVKSLSLANISSITLTQSINYDNREGSKFNSLNYNPIIFTNLTQYNINKLYINFFFIYTSGRYLFSRQIESYYSSINTNYNYSVSTDYSKQFQLNPYYRFDISLLYKIIQGNFNLNLGLSLLNVFDHQNESNRNFNIDLSQAKLNSKSDYFNLPRFLIFEINIGFVL